MERLCLQKGVRYVIGVDEVGRGAIAGPVFAGAVAFTPESLSWWERQGFDDSKVIAAPRRRELSDLMVHEQTVFHALGSVSHDVVDSRGIVGAVLEAFRCAVVDLVRQLPNEICPKRDIHVLLDGRMIIPQFPFLQTPVEKGDALILSCAAASILAKVARDAEMDEHGARYAPYGFSKNKGYGTNEHRCALKRFGPCAIHRRTFLSSFMRSGSGK